MQTVSIIIPVYNEEKRIGKTIEEVIRADTLGMKKEIIVVDDGSTDETVNNVKNQILNSKHNQKPNQISNSKSQIPNKQSTQYNIQLIQLSQNQGKGAALKEGFKKATGDIFVVQDADLEYSIIDYPILLRPFKEDSAQIVYGSRNKARKKYRTSYSSLTFFWGGLLLTWIMNILFETKLSDQATGYKLFSKKLKKLLLQPKENRFSYEVALTATLSKEKIPFIEIPIHYQPRSIKEGKKINIMDFVESVVVAMKYKLKNQKSEVKSKGKS